jgi:hypothetical protein
MESAINTLESCIGYEEEEITRLEIEIERLNTEMAKMRQRRIESMKHRDSLQEGLLTLVNNESR